jgi:hypothetical protein
VSYFRPENAREIAPRSVCRLPNSTQKVSQKGGRVNPAKCAHSSCLISRVQSSLSIDYLDDASSLRELVGGLENWSLRTTDCRWPP